MNNNELKKLLVALQDGHLQIEEVLERLQSLPFEDIGVARIDHHRELRQGVPEVILGEGKTAEQILSIVSAMAERGRNILVTRIASEKSIELISKYPDGSYDPTGRTFSLVQGPLPGEFAGPLLVVCAGTSDLPVTREAVTTATMLGLQVEELIDVGVAGIHRLFSESEQLSRAAAIIVVAGMEGALPRSLVVWSPPRLLPFQPRSATARHSAA